MDAGWDEQRDPASGPGFHPGRHHHRYPVPLTGCLRAAADELQRCNSSTNLSTACGRRARIYSSVAISSMSSMQWRGGSGLSSVATVIRTSVPQRLHRYCSLTFRSSPTGGGSGSGVASVRRTARPIRSRTMATAMAMRILRTSTCPAYGPPPGGRPWARDAHRFCSGR